MREYPVAGHYWQEFTIRQAFPSMTHDEYMAMPYDKYVAWSVLLSLQSMKREKGVMKNHGR